MTTNHKSHRPGGGSKDPPTRPLSPRGAPRTPARLETAPFPLIKPPAHPVPKPAKQRTRAKTLPGTHHKEAEEVLELKAGDMESIPPSKPPQRSRLSVPPPIPMNRSIKSQTLLPPALPVIEGGERVKLLGILRYILLTWAAENRHSPSLKSVLEVVATECPELGDLLNAHKMNLSKRAH